MKIDCTISMIRSGKFVFCGLILLSFRLHNLCVEQTLIVGITIRYPQRLVESESFPTCRLTKTTMSHKLDQGHRLAQKRSKLSLCAARSHKLSERLPHEGDHNHNRIVFHARTSEFRLRSSYAQQTIKHSNHCLT